jgi:hypothetical protein
MSPSPCRWHTVGLALDAGDAGFGLAVQLEYLDIEVVGERGVTADAEHRDRALDRRALGDRSARSACDRLAAPVSGGAPQLVSAGVKSSTSCAGWVGGALVGITRSPSIRSIS